MYRVHCETKGKQQRLTPSNVIMIVKPFFRKTSKNNLGSVSKTTDSSEIGINGSSVNSTNDTKEPDNRENQSKLNKTRSNSAESSTNFKEGEANNDENSAHTSSPNPLQHQIRKVVEKRRTTRRKQATDESDLSLALALSESLQSANESARRHEEDILLTVRIPRLTCLFF